MRRVNTDVKSISNRRQKQRLTNKHKKSRSAIKGRKKTSNQKIQNWGLEFFNRANDGVQEISLKEKIYEILSGESHIFFLTKNKQIYGAGNNEYGQLGLPSQSRVVVPQLLHFSEKITISRVYVGADFSFCSSSKGQVYSWGLNLKGQLGLGHNENVPYPCLVKTLSPAAKSKDDRPRRKKSILKERELVVDIACGALHSLVLTNKSRLFRAGFGHNFSLGHHNNQSINNFKEVAFFHQLSSGSSHKIEKICCGTSHSGALVAGKVYLWGTFAHSKFGLNKVPNAVPLQHQITDFVLGDLLTVMLTSEGEVFTLGENTDNQLGYEDTEPHQYQTLAVEIPCKIEYICCGLNHVIAINNTQGKIFGWGSNRFGQVHPGSSSETIFPPLKLSWMYAAKAYIITCGPFNTILVSAKRARVPANGPGAEELQSLNGLKKQIESVKRKARKINEENDKLKGELSSLHDTVNSQLDSMTESMGEDDEEDDSDS